MNEKDFNTILNRSLKTLGFSYKIPDPSAFDATITIKRPFDIFCVNPLFIAYIESKLLKGYQSFNFKRLQEHQSQSLEDIDYIVGQKKEWDNIYPLVVVAFWSSREYYDIYFIHIEVVIRAIEKGKKSILKKEFLELKKKELFLTVKNKCIEVEKIPDKIIYEV